VAVVVSCGCNHPSCSVQDRREKNGEGKESNAAWCGYITGIWWGSRAKGFIMSCPLRNVRDEGIHPVEWLVLIEIYGFSDILQENVVYPRDLTTPWVAGMELGFVLLEQALLTYWER
jgi:hypothetical protein